MNRDVFDRYIEALREHADLLSDRLRDVSLDTRALRTADDAALQVIVESLTSAVEELHVSEEELRAQSEEILRVEGMLEAERRRYQELFDLAPDAYLVTDAKGTILEANRAAGSLLRIPRVYMVGKPLSAFVAEHDHAAFLRKIKELARPIPTGSGSGRCVSARDGGCRSTRTYAWRPSMIERER